MTKEVGPSPHTWGFRTHCRSHPSTPAVHPHIRGVFDLDAYTSALQNGPSPHTWGFRRVYLTTRPPGRSIPTYVGFSHWHKYIWFPFSVHPHIRGVFCNACFRVSFSRGPSPHTWGFRLLFPTKHKQPRSIPTYVGFSLVPTSRIHPVPVHPHIRGVFVHKGEVLSPGEGPSPHTWGFLKKVVRKECRRLVHPHIRGVFTEIKSKISRASSKTALLPAEKFKILFLVKIKSSAAAFQVHTIFRDQFPPGLHFEIALHL